MIRLEPFAANDVARLINWVNSPEMLMQFAGPAFSFPLSEEQIRNDLKDPDKYIFRVTDSETNYVIGHAEIHCGTDVTYLCRILIGDQQKRGKGIGLLVVRELLHFAFHTLHRSDIQLNVFDHNLSAIHCYQKAGFVFSTNKGKERTVNGKTWTSRRMIWKPNE